VSVDGGVGMERESVDGEAPLACGKREFFVISKVFTAYSGSFIRIGELSLRGGGKFA
jgi:hypothetical protein